MRSTSRKWTRLSRSRRSASEAVAAWGQVRVSTRLPSFRIGIRGHGAQAEAQSKGLPSLTTQIKPLRRRWALSEREAMIARGVPDPKASSGSIGRHRRAVLRRRRPIWNALVHSARPAAPDGMTGTNPVSRQFLPAAEPRQTTTEGDVGGWRASSLGRHRLHDEHLLPHQPTTCELGACAQLRVGLIDEKAGDGLVPTAVSSPFTAERVPPQLDHSVVAGRSEQDPRDDGPDAQAQGTDAQEHE